MFFSVELWRLNKKEDFHPNRKNNRECSGCHTEGFELDLFCQQMSVDKQLWPGICILRLTISTFGSMLLERIKCCQFYRCLERRWMRRASTFPPKCLDYFRKFVKDIMTSEAMVMCLHKTLAMLLLLYLLWALVIFLVVVTRYLTKNDLMEKEFILVFSLRRDIVCHNKNALAAGA